MTWEDLQVGILEDFARLQEVFYVDRHTAAMDHIMESRREAVRNYRARLAPDTKRRQNRERWARRKAAPGFKERERERVSAWKRTRGMRERPETTREGITHHFVITTKTDGVLHDVDGYIQTGTYPDGRLAELFIKVGKQGDFHAVLDQFAIAASVALQYGAPVNEFFKKFLGTRFEPSGATTNKDIPRCTSVLDYVARFILAKHE